MGKHEKTRYRTVWISDVHLGTKSCQVERLIAFLQSIQCEHLYLVGDIIDLWALKRKWYWPASHSDVIRRILKRDIKGTKVIFVPGNHDEAFRDYNGLHFGGVEIINEAVHTTADGKKVVIIHGDAFDYIIQNYHLLTHLGDWAYDWLLWLNRRFNRLRHWFGFGYWSLSNYVKQHVKTIVSFIGNFEQSLVRYAHKHKADIVVSGHIHRPEVKQIGDVMYSNNGDWVENCSAVVEHLDGRIELLRFGLHDAPGQKKLFETALDEDAADAPAEPALEPATVGAQLQPAASEREALTRIATDLSVDPSRSDAGDSSDSNRCQAADTASDPNLVAAK